MILAYSCILKLLVHRNPSTSLKLTVTFSGYSRSISEAASLAGLEGNAGLTISAAGSPPFNGHENFLWSVWLLRWVRPQVSIKYQLYWCLHRALLPVGAYSIDGVKQG